VRGDLEVIQTIREARIGTEFVCEIPEGWNAALYNDGRQVKVVMVYADCPPIVVERDTDGIWRQREITLDASPSPQG